MGGVMRACFGWESRNKPIFFTMKIRLPRFLPAGRQVLAMTIIIYWVGRPVIVRSLRDGEAITKCLNKGERIGKAKNKNSTTQKEEVWLRKDAELLSKSQRSTAKYKTI